MQVWHAPHTKQQSCGGLQRCGGGGLRLSQLVVVVKVLLSLVVHGSKKTTAQQHETCFPLQAEFAHCVTKAMLQMSQK